MDKTFQELTKENRISILVDKYENEEICPKCGKILKNDIINEIISANNKINSSLKGIKRQIEFIMTDINNKVDINDISTQLENVIIVINKIKKDIKNINNKFNMTKLDENNIIKSNNNKKEEIIKNEIKCIYNKQEDEIILLHDYSEDTNDWSEEGKKSYIEGKNNINENNIDIYINDKKIKFNYKYKSNNYKYKSTEKGNIQVKFIFNKLLNSTCFMLAGCSSLKSIDLSSFNTNNVNNMRCMFSECSSLKSIDLSSFNTTNVEDMGCMFYGCSSLKKENVKISSYGKRIIM